MSRDEDIIAVDGPGFPTLMLWLSWSLYCYGYGLMDARRRALLLAASFAVGGFLAGLTL